MKNHADDLAKLIAGEVNDSDIVREEYSRDASVFAVVPEFVAYPKDAKDIEKTVLYASEKKRLGENISVTARAAGTDMSGGPLNTSIILDTTRHINRLLGINERDMSAIVEPGMYFRDFDAETKKYGMELPSYTASRDLCTVGGMAANDSGGEKHLKYGKTAAYVEELEVVLSDGKLHTLKALKGKELTGQLNEDSFLGEVYRKMRDLLAENKSVIEKARPSVAKNSSGYAIWDIGDPEKGEMNLARLMVGAQGTLGIITRIKFKLVRPKPYGALTVLFLKDVKELGGVINTLLEHSPDSIESYDDHTFALALKYFPELARSMKANIVALAVSFIPEMWMVIKGLGLPKLVLLVEFRSESKKEALECAENAKNVIESLYPEVGARVAGSERDMQKYWTMRRESFNLLRSRLRGLRTAPVIDDFVVDPAKLPEFLPKLEKILSRYDLMYTIAGHAGDGNLHIIPLIDPKRKDAIYVLGNLSRDVYGLVLEYDGSITGEHNDGLIRTPFIKDMFGGEMVSLFEEVKKIFDPLNIFNPGKKVGLTAKEAEAFLDFPHDKKHAGVFLGAKNDL